MGEVYRAHDPRPKREVALEILPPAVADDPIRRQCFEQKARAVATLNHPNIVAIYGIGSENGVLYIVTELVDGESLSGAKLSLRRTLDCAVQIAAGLAAAHAALIIHRDLSPAISGSRAMGASRFWILGWRRCPPPPFGLARTKRKPWSQKPIPGKSWARSVTCHPSR
jgi:hypothetical protein